MSQFSAYEYRTQPGFDQNKFEGANQAIPMKTLVIHCFDPRAAEIPQKIQVPVCRSLKARSVSEVPGSAKGQNDARTDLGRKFPTKGPTHSSLH